MSQHTGDAQSAAKTQRTTENPVVWPVVVYRDPAAGLTFLAEAFGLVETVRHEDDGVVAHAELASPSGVGGVMVGAAREGSPFADSVGHAVVYVVTDDPDGLHARAVAAGAEILQPPTEQSYGSREFAAKDREGNLWSFGTYGGE